VDYGGLSFNEAGRLYALAWPANRQTLRVEQCAGYTIPYAFFSPGNYRFWEERDPHNQRLISIHMYFQTSEVNRTIWMDGRPHPPAYAAYTWQGFSTGHWDGDMLTIDTDHLKMGWIRRNGVARSPKATVIEHLIRHDDNLTVVVLVTDPVYLTEPFIRTTDFVADPRQQIGPYPCDVVNEVSRPKGEVPSHLPGTNTFLTEFAARYNIPYEATRGGAETMYPEYRVKLKQMELPKISQK